MTGRRFAATVSYDGTGFTGSQRQANVRTVQEELETAATALFGEPVRVAMAGRTDAGVHAIGQVAAFTAETRLEAATVGKALNAHLPEDVAVRDVRAVDAGFDPRRHALRRWYRYTVYNGNARAPLLRQRSWHIRATLDVALMAEAASALEGRQDFMACSGPLEDDRTSVRTVFTAGWRREGCAVLFDIEAESFLPQMVRRMVGALVRVGRGSLQKEEFVHVLKQALPASIGPTAPAQGLCLQRVWYDEQSR
ncbi:MAG: tRNA pseudouridine(38-40) synthase TruA [Tepidiformaceae bacterium]